jgi:hypothetical protein
MKQLLTFLFLISSFVSFGQFAPTSAKTKFVNGIGIGSKDTSQFTAADTIALTIARDSVMYYRYRGFWRPIATGGNLSAYKLISDTLFNNGYTTRARLKQGLDSLAATKGTVNSVGLTMPSAFNVANSPITTSGTLAVTAAGNATQYIRGDGVLANLPTSGDGGGASVSYYLNGSVNQGTIGGVTYYEMNKTPIIGAGTDFTTSSNGYIASFLTDANDPALLVIPAGNWNFETYFQVSSGGGSPTFYIELYKYDGTTFTLIASNSTSPKLINDGTSIEAYFSALAVPQTTLTLTDRLAVRIYVTTAGRTITLHTENGHLCQVITTFTTGLTALNGLTAQVQYLATGTSGTDFNIASATATHTFNLPTASATNRGALSSANWTTFNNKIGAGDTASMLLPYTRVQRFTDSLTNVQSRIQTKLNISDTSAMLSPYARTSNLPSLAPYKLISDTLFVNGYTTRGTTKKVIDSLAAIELNISDTSAMLSNYRRTSTKITNSDLVNSTISGVSLGGNLFSHSNGYGISGSAYNGSAAQTWLVDTANISTKANVTALLLGKQNNITLTTTGTSGAATLVGATLNIPQYQAAGTYVTSVTASSPLASSGGTTPNITIQQASGSQNGFLSSTDWTTFNNKQNALTNPVTGTGTTNYLPKFTGASTIGNSQLFDNGTNVGIGTASPSIKLSVNTNAAGAIANFTDGVAQTLRITTGTGFAAIDNPSAGALAFQIASSERMRLDASGNLGLGVTPSAWASDWTVLQIGSISSLSQYNSNNSVLLTNNYYNATTSGAAPRYIANGAAGAYQIASNIHYWYNAPTGTANSAMTLTAAMTLGANGNLLVGTTTDNGARLQVAGSGTFSGDLRVNSGNVIIQSVATNNSWVGDNFYYDGAFKYKANGFATALYFDGSEFQIRTVGSGSTNAAFSWTTPFKISNTTGAATFSSTLGINGVADNVKGGTYTPTLSNTFNITSSALVTGSAIKYIRVGNIVTVTGRATVTPTTANFVTLTLSLPISSTSSDVGMVIGTASNTIEGGIWGTVSPSTNSAFINFYNSLVTAYDIYFSFTYQVQ